MSAALNAVKYTGRKAPLMCNQVYEQQDGGIPGE